MVLAGEPSSSSSSSASSSLDEEQPQDSCCYVTMERVEGRLRGGSSVNETEDMKELLRVSDDEEPKAKKPAVAPPVTAKVKPEKPKVSKLLLGLKYSKIVSIVLILLLAIILMSFIEVKADQKHQVVVHSGEEKRFKIKGFEEVKELEMEFVGPFLSYTQCSNDPAIIVSAVTKNGDDERRSENRMKLCLMDPKIFDSADHIALNDVFDLPNNRDEKTEVYASFRAENLKEDVGFSMIARTPIDKRNGIIYGTIVLILLYAMIVTEIVNRTFASLIAAGLSLGVLSLCQAKIGQYHLIKWIDVETLALLVGMMLLVAILAESGIFDYFAVLAFKLAKGRVWPLINCLSLFTSTLAMFLDSVTMMLLATPVTIRLCEVLSVDPVPVLICMIVFANVGAALTPVGDPPNVIITLNPVISKSGVNFGNFVLHMFPGVLMALAQTYAHVRLLYRKPESLQFKESKELQNLRHEIATWERTAAGISPYSQDEDVAREVINDRIAALKEKLEEVEKSGPSKTPLSFEETLAEMKKQYPLRDKVLLIKASITFALILFLFFSHSIPGMLHIPLGWSALLGAFLLLIIADRRDLEAILLRIEWSTLLFFASLFVVMESLSLLGVIDLIGTFVVTVISSVSEKYQIALAIVIVLWTTAIASAFLDNIPVTTMMVKIILRLAADPNTRISLHPLVWSLALGACFGGNGTLIGASANVVTAGVAEQHGYKISFIKFFIVCFPIMLGNICVATVYLLIAHVVFSWHD